MGLCVLNGFSFVAEKEHNFSNNENIALFLLNRKEKNPTLSDLTQVFCGPLSLLYKKKNLSENKMHRYHAYLCVLRSCCLVSSHNAPYSQFESERVAGRGQNRQTLFVYS